MISRLNSPSAITDLPLLSALDLGPFRVVADIITYLGIRLDSNYSNWEVLKDKSPSLYNQADLFYVYHYHQATEINIAGLLDSRQLLVRGMDYSGPSLN